MKPVIKLVGLVFLLLCGIGHGQDRDEILIADFESETYGNWQTTGQAFGPGPAKGTLPNQMPVSGFRGERLVNSYFAGDGSTGTLTSPPFKIERRFINFLIGGGQHPDQTCIQLIVDDKVVENSTGANDRPGGSEQLEWSSWDVGKLSGKQAVIKVVDTHTGGWGHINVDQIVQSDKKLQAEPASKEFLADKQYLLLPVKTGSTMRRLKLESNGQVVREWDMELADESPQFVAFLDLSRFHGQRLKLSIDRLTSDSKGWKSITTSDVLPPDAGTYREPVRPGFHFTSRVGWLNDPNGLVYHAGEWHLFYQHNPYGWNWGNMHWGHAVSSDLLHWRHLPIALYPPKHGDWCFSGSAIVDVNNTSGWKQGPEPPLVAAFTSTGRGECILYSNDRGRTWSEFERNPVVKHEGRDPRLLWHAESKAWVMAVYDELDKKQWIAFYTSPNLKDWTYQSRIEGFFECPDLIRLPVEGTNEYRWLLYAADGKYVLGQFDGREFRPEAAKQQLWFGNFYAAQTFTNSPDERCVIIGWGNGITFPGQPFNQQMSIPCELKLRLTKDGIRLFALPVKEIAGLRESVWTGSRNVTVKPGTPQQGMLPSELCDIEMELEVGESSKIAMSLRGIPIVFDAKKRELSCLGKSAPLAIDGKRLSLRFLLDRGSIEIFGGNGRVAMSIGVIPERENREWSISTEGGESQIVSAVFHPLKSVW